MRGRGRVACQFRSDNKASVSPAGENALDVPRESSRWPRNNNDHRAFPRRRFNVAATCARAHTENDGRKRRGGEGRGGARMNEHPLTKC